MPLLLRSLSLRPASSLPSSVRSRFASTSLTAFEEFVNMLTNLAGRSRNRPSSREARLDEYGYLSRGCACRKVDPGDRRRERPRPRNQQGPRRQGLEGSHLRPPPPTAGRSGRENLP